MEKLIYIAYIDRKIDLGVYKKILAKCGVFAKIYDVALICREGNSICIENIKNKSVKYIDNRLLTLNKEDKLLLIKRYINYSRFNSYVQKALIELAPKYLYIRKYKFLSKGLKALKFAKKNLNCYIMYEIPSYPDDLEIKGVGRRILNALLSKVYDVKVEKIVDKIYVVLGKDIILKSDKYKEITNGIDISDIRIKELYDYKNMINLIAVANVSYWHGYDRVIEGLRLYYESKNKDRIRVNFHIVGDGPELNKLKKIANDYGLNEYVVFHGNKIGKELDDLFDISNIGIGSLANHRKGFTKDSALKNREYCARGIPFVIASDDEMFGDNFKYIYKIPKDESPIDINKVIEFYNLIKKEKFTIEMRKYAEENLTWNAVMRDILNDLRVAKSKNHNKKKFE
ncbi:glycosyltransferase [Caloramator proteoclasticus]|uniref:Glycosyltransferase involved in cell wall bisynthesis n=1 Tax=Caloramator proteoclasticus DSM 10124 TaxID=1121262 RepID=A0A1M4WL11_9CLOT|nr:glycosyltransferase [Caloramator proteoclasticus]SHE81884.1 Glycosyltransferase involved in cell wall bisynthesis [Caloramator proteoclasticus DSM 10124]